MTGSTHLDSPSWALSTFAPAKEAAITGSGQRDIAMDCNFVRDLTVMMEPV